MMHAGGEIHYVVHFVKRMALRLKWRCDTIVFVFAELTIMFLLHCQCLVSEWWARRTE